MVMFLMADSTGYHGVCLEMGIKMRPGGLWNIYARGLMRAMDVIELVQLGGKIVPDNSGDVKGLGSWSKTAVLPEEW